MLRRQGFEFGLPGSQADGKLLIALCACAWRMFGGVMAIRSISPTCKARVAFWFACVVLYVAYSPVRGAARDAVGALWND